MDHDFSIVHPLTVKSCWIININNELELQLASKWNMPRITDLLLCLSVKIYYGTAG